VRVLYVNQTAQVSGAEHSLLTLLAAAAGEVDAVVACPAGELAEAVRAAGVPVVEVHGTDASFRLHPRHTPKGLAELAVSAAGVARAVRRVRPDVVHANSIRAGLMAAPTGAAAPVPLVTSLRDLVPDSRMGRTTLRAIRAGADAVVVNSRWLADQLPPHAGGPPVRVVHNPVDAAAFDPARFDRAEARRRLDLPTGDPVLGVVGQIAPLKGQREAIETLALVREERPDARLVIAGSAKFAAPGTRQDNVGYAAALPARAAELGVRDAVLFAGERRDVPDVMAALDVLLVPSWYEGFGRVALEAMAMQVPVVATSNGGPAEVVRDGVDGRVLAPRDPAAWARAVSGLLAEPRTLAAMGRAGRERALRDFQPAQHAAAMLGVYASVARKRR
jgi:glycosyltransferase involved in cell wall biosynthesis